MSRFRSAFAVRLCAVGTAAILQAVWLGLYARGSGPESFGVFSVYFAAGTICATILGFGLNNYALRLPYADDTARQEVGNLLILRAVAVIVIVVLSIGAVVFSPGMTSVIVIASLALIGELLSDLAQGIYSGQRRIVLTASLLVLQRIPPVIALIASTVFDSSIDLLAAGLLVGGLVPLAALVRLASPPRSVSRTLSAARHYWSASIVATFSQFDLPLVAFVGGTSIAGYYGAATRLAGPANIATNALLTVFVPELAASQSREKQLHLYKKVRFFALLAGVCIASLAFPLANLAVLFLGPAYQGATLFIAAFLTAAALSGLSRAFQAALYSFGHPRPAARAIFIGTMVGLAAIPIIGSLYDPQALAIVPVIAQTIIALLMFTAMRRVERGLA